MNIEKLKNALEQQLPYLIVPVEPAIISQKTNYLKLDF
jgi:hypothetical protein